MTEPHDITQIPGTDHGECFTANCHGRGWFEVQGKAHCWEHAKRVAGWADEAGVVVDQERYGVDTGVPRDSGAGRLLRTLYPGVFE